MAINLKSRNTAKEALKIHSIPIHQIKILPQVRQDIDEDFESSEMMQLVDSIETNGLLNPITLRRDEDNTLILVAGHRRLNACKKLGLTTINATILEISEDEASFIQLTENITRKDLRFYDISMQVAKIAKLINPNTRKCYTQTEIAKRLGMDQGDISRHLSLSKADTGILHLCKQGKLTSLRAACALMELYRVSYPSAQKLIRMDRLTLDSINQELRSVKNILTKESENEGERLLKPEKQPAMFIDEHGKTEMSVVSPETMKGMLESDPIYQSQAEKDNHKYALNNVNKDKQIESFDNRDIALTIVSLDDIGDDELPPIPNTDGSEEGDTESDTASGEIFGDSSMTSSMSVPGRYIRVSVNQPNGETVTGELNFDEDSTVNRKSGQTYVHVILESGEDLVVNVNNIKIIEIGDR